MSFARAHTHTHTLRLEEMGVAFFTLRCCFDSRYDIEVPVVFFVFCVSWIGWISVYFFLNSYSLV